MTSHVIAYLSLELLFGTHTFHFNCFFEDFNCVFTQIRCLSRVLRFYLSYDITELSETQNYAYWDANFLPGMHGFHQARVPRTHVFLVGTCQKSSG